MDSAVAISFELDDVGQAAEQLVSGIRAKVAVRPDALGILYCDADVDGAALTGALSEELGCEVVGMTTLAALGPGGMNELSSVLTVITGDDVKFAAKATDSLGSDTAQTRIGAACDEIKAGIGEPKMLMIFAPTDMPFAGDVYPDAISRAAPGVPLLGGVASDDYDFERARVFMSGRDFRDAAVFAGIAGDVSPRFFLTHVTSRFAERRLPVTKSDGTVVYKVGDESFIEYLEGFGMRTDVSDAIVAFNSYPMMLTREGSDETPLMRHISGLDHETGAGMFLGNVPEGAIANICLVNKDDLVSSCRLSMEKLAESARTGEGSLVLCISCCGRSMVLLERMGGSVSLLSKPGEGSAFSIEIPLEIAANEDDPDAGEDRAADGACFDGKTILLAEDVEINREIVMSLLEGTGVAVEEAADGEEAVKMFSGAPARYDLILMDIQMPGMDGIEAARAIRGIKSRQGHGVPIVAMSANAFKEDVEASLSAGMNEHLSKPVDRRVLMGALRRYLL